MNSQLQVKSYFDELVKTLSGHFNSYVNKELPFQKPEHEWLNYFYNSATFRHIHLEYYKTNKICALHLTILPTPSFDYPILGFDMIALGDKITGLFFDITPTVTEHKKLSKKLITLNKNIKSTKRPLPEWADIFSKNFVCIAPNIEELPSIFDTTVSYINDYLTYSNSLLNKNIESQNKYCLGQKKNEKTFKALTAEVGKNNAQIFFDKYLFPEID
jgi:Ferredoxin-dependent bilin reductase